MGKFPTFGGNGVEDERNRKRCCTHNNTWSFCFTSFEMAGRLVIVRDDAGNPIESYTYGASRQRLLTASGSLLTFYAWGGTNVLCEYTEATGNTASFRFSKSYVYAGSRLLSTQTWNGATEVTEFHHPDRLGTKVVTNNAANTSYEQSTLPFGTSLDGEFIGTPTTNQRFTSYERSAATGLDYAQNRNYSPGQGRFTTVDPAQDGMNLYAYVGNDPINNVDPTGLYENASHGDDGEVIRVESEHPGAWDWGLQRFFRDSLEFYRTRRPITEGEPRRGGDDGGGVGSKQDEPSQECLDALAKMNKGLYQYNNAKNLMGVFKKYAAIYGEGWASIFAAMAIRESGADPAAEQFPGEKRGGKSLMQVDISQQPGRQYANDPNLRTPEGNINITIEMMGNEGNRLSRKYGFTGESLVLVMIRSHNAGPFKKGKREDQERMRKLASSTNPYDYDVGTYNGNYVSSVVGVMRKCFMGKFGN